MENINLKEMLSKEYLLKDGVSDLEKKFDEIAEILLTKTKIVKGLQEYYITDIEFYLYCKGHEDIITYPRKCYAGEWFFHDSGVDISFASNVEFKNGKAELLDSSFFGGILLRGIKLIKGGSVEKKELNDKPSNVFYELFRNFDAFCGNVEFPKLVKRGNDEIITINNISEYSQPRKNLLSGYDTEDKINEIAKKEIFTQLVENKVLNISYNYNNKDTINTAEFHQHFKSYFAKPYRYTLKESK